MFKGLGGLRFKDLDAAKGSVARLEVLFQRFKQTQDRRGMHQCQVMALVGKNRAEGVGKANEARLFADWLRGALAPILQTETPPKKDAA